LGQTTRMNTFAIILLGLLEMIAWVVIVRLWLRRRHRILPRILWSVVLLVPLFGLVFYGFIASDLEKHSLGRFNSQTDSDAFTVGMEDFPNAVILPNKSMITNRRCPAPLAARPELGCAIHAAALLPAVAAYLRRWAD
jgi:hypothetical protein